MTSTDHRIASATVGGGRGVPPPRALLGVEAALLLLAPLLAVVAVRTGPMSQGLQTAWTMVDPNIYTAYAQHGGDLIARFGAQDYFWVRLGFIMPAQASAALFGPVGGFVVLRYVLALLAVVPGYMLFRRVASRQLAWVFVAATLTSPVVLMAWGSDYPDSAAISYLMGGTALAMMPASQRSWRLAARAGAGALLGLAVHSHAASVPLVLAVVLGALVAWRGPRPGWRDLAALVAGGLVVTLLVVAYAGIAWGHPDVFSPTADQYFRLQRPDQVRIWHSATWGWLDRDTYLLVPALGVLAWSAVTVARRVRPRSWEAGLAVSAALGVVLFVLVQATGGFTLEYYFYSSLLWASVPFVATIVVLAALRDRSSRDTAIAAAVVAAVPVLAAWTPLPTLRFAVLPVGLVIALAVAAACGLGRRLPWGAVVALIVGSWLLTVGQPVTGYVRGQVPFPLADFSAVSRDDDAQARDVYRVISEVAPLVPSGRVPGERVLTWMPPPAPGTSLPNEAVSRASAQYLSSRLSSAMPRLSAADATQLDRAGPVTVVLLSESGREFRDAVQTLGRWAPQPADQHVLVSGGVRLTVLAVRLR